MTSIHFAPEAHDSLLTVANGLIGFTVEVTNGDFPVVILGAYDDGLHVVAADDNGRPMRPEDANPAIEPWDDIDRITVL